MSSELFERVRENGQTAAKLVASLDRVLANPQITAEQTNLLLNSVHARKLQIEALIGDLLWLDDQARLARLANRISELWDAIASKIEANCPNRNDSKRAA